MRLWILLALSAALLSASDDQRLALSLQAQNQFERVELAATPDLRETLACTQNQAALLPVAAPEDLALIHYRKGFCMLAGATITREPSAFTDAAAELDKAVEAWPAHGRNSDKKAPAEPVPNGLRILASIARLEAGQNAALAVTDPVCSPSLMSAPFCGALTEIGHEWEGWLALQRNDLKEASRDFAGLPKSGWFDWVGGRQAFQAGDYRQAVFLYSRAIDQARLGDPAVRLGYLAPRPDLASELTELGGTRLLAGDATGAIATLDEAVHLAPQNARALFLRARARETAGQAQAALADYNLASRTAYAGAPGLVSPEAHLYRGILLYRRKDFAKAEDEFSSALNLEMGDSLRADIEAWRHLAAVASGSCDAARQMLERSLNAASPFFPKAEAQSLIVGCNTVQGL